MTSKRWWRIATRARLVAHAEPQRSGQCVAPRPGGAPGRDTLGPAPGAAGPCTPCVLVIGLLPEQLERCVAEVGAVRTRLETDSALVAIRALSAAQLPALPAPLGFHPHRRGSTIRNRPFQHKMGPDPPAAPP